MVPYQLQRIKLYCGSLSLRSSGYQAAGEGTALSTAALFFVENYHISPYFSLFVTVECHFTIIFYYLSLFHTDFHCWYSYSVKNYLVFLNLPATSSQGRQCTQSCCTIFVIFLLLVLSLEFWSKIHQSCSNTSIESNLILFTNFKRILVYFGQKL